MTSDAPLSIVFAIHSLAARTGGQLFIRDVANCLVRLGHRPAVWTPDRVSGVADELLEVGIPVLCHLDDLPESPDVIYGHTTSETVACALHFGAIPSVFHCHGVDGFTTVPPRIKAIRRYTCTGSHTLARLVRDFGVPEELVSVVPNGIDTRRFRPRVAELPPTPRRAAVFSSSAQPRDICVIDQICRDRGIELELIGGGLGREVRQPEEILARFDVVFASGRAAMESASVGCAVVVWHPRGNGGMLSVANLDNFLSANVGVPTYVFPNTSEYIEQALDAYDPAATKTIRERIRSSHSLEQTVTGLLVVLNDAIRDQPALETPRTDQARLADWIADQGLALARAEWKLYQLETTVEWLQNELQRRESEIEKARSLGPLVERLPPDMPLPFMGEFRTISHGKRGGPIALLGEPPNWCWADHDDNRLVYKGTWELAHLHDDYYGRLALGTGNEQVLVRFDGTEFIGYFWAHPWGGEVLIDVDGDVQYTSLFDPWGSFLAVHIQALDSRTHVVVIKATGVQSRYSHGAQVILFRVGWASVQSGSSKCAAAQPRDQDNRGSRS